MLSPQSVSRSFPSTPQLLEAMVRFLAPESRMALTRFMGTPQKPKPPDEYIGVVFDALECVLGLEDYFGGTVERAGEEGGQHSADGWMRYNFDYLVS